MTNASVFTLSVPGKTFLLGEYAVLSGGPSLIITTPPPFTLCITAKKTEPIATPFHPKSPAGKLFLTHERLHNYQYNFSNPYAHNAGFGASTAEFLSLYLFLQQEKQCAFKLETLLTDYQNIAYSGTGLKPSGADLLAQAKNTLYGKKNVYALQKVHNAQVESAVWPFSALKLCLIHTGQKLATHEHLLTLNTTDFSAFFPLVEKAYDALHLQNANLFCEAINHYAMMLAEHELVASHTQTYIDILKACPGVNAIKGCGALGADVLLALVEVTQLDGFHATLERLELKTIFTV